VIFCNTDESETEEFKYAQILAQKQVDGVILVPACSSAKAVEFFQANDIPVVLIDRTLPGVDTDMVHCDSVAGAHQLVKLLLELGHTHIAALTGPRGVSTAEDRIQGYRRALVEAGLEDKEMVYYGYFTQDSGYETALKVMESTPPPTAIFCANNFITIGVMKAMRAAGVRVPEDTAIVGFDDLPVNLVIDPFFTVAAQPAYLMGQRGTQMLLDRLKGEARQGYQQEILPVEIITRESSGPMRI
jgi:LacI family transcriptional regulator